MPSIAIVDYGSGNLRSAEKALARMIGEAGLDHAVAVTGDANRVAEAERIVLPGVGAFADCMRGLSSIPGMIDALEDSVLRRGRPFLGICVGLQLLASVGREHGDHRGLGWIDGEVRRIAPRDPALKIPHMGWNTLNVLRPHPLLEGMSGSDVYFVHSYAFYPADREAVFATTEYDSEIVAFAGRDNIAATQFHPEKSQAAGLALLRRFVSWRP